MQKNETYTRNKCFIKKNADYSQLDFFSVYVFSSHVKIDISRCPQELELPLCLKKITDDKSHDF
jgi:hypothetical protein